MKKFILLPLLAIFAMSCNDQPMTISILENKNLQNVPSGSGITKAGDNYYVIGDDSPFLYSLNKDFEVTSKILLFGSDTINGKRIEKADKPDFEALEWINENEMIVFGSGSKSPQRDHFIRILMGDSVTVEKYQISNFYNGLKNLPELKNSELNIEAVAFRDGEIFIFNRKKSVIFRFDYNDLLAHFKGGANFPEPKISVIDLPNINGIEAGLSGAVALKNEPKIIFTASVENTDNAYDDGEILGSFIGIIDVSGDNIPNPIIYCEIPNGKTNLKVESVAIKKEIAPQKLDVVLITDDDNGNSLVINGIISW